VKSVSAVRGAETLQRCDSDAARIGLPSLCSAVEDPL